MGSSSNGSKLSKILNLRLQMAVILFYASLVLLPFKHKQLIKAL